MTNPKALFELSRSDEDLRYELRFAMQSKMLSFESTRTGTEPAMIRVLAAADLLAYTIEEAFKGSAERAKHHVSHLDSVIHRIGAEKHNQTQQKAG
jgi:hypothetical protein